MLKQFVGTHPSWCCFANKVCTTGSPISAKQILACVTLCLSNTVGQGHKVVSTACVTLRSHKQSHPFALLIVPLRDPPIVCSGYEFIALDANLLLGLLRDRALLRVAWLTINKFKPVATTGHVVAQATLNLQRTGVSFSKGVEKGVEDYKIKNQNKNQ